jgi:hypothetical protein
LLAGAEHIEDAEAFSAVGERKTSRFDRVEELLALVAEGFFLRKRDGDGLGLDGRGNAVFPLDLVRIEDELFGCGVVKDGHLGRADDDQALLLKGMKPGDEDVGADAVGEAELRERDVWDVGIEVAAALAGDGLRLFAEEAKQDGDVVGREGPEDVFFSADFADVEAVGVDVVDPAEVAVGDEALELAYSGVVLEDVADHEDPLVFCCDADQFGAFLHVEREGLFNEDVFAGEQSAFRHLVVADGGSGEDHAVDSGSAEDVFILSAEDDAGIFGADGFKGRGVFVAEGAESAEFEEVAGEVLAPVSMPYDCDVGGHGISNVRFDFRGKG